MKVTPLLDEKINIYDSEMSAETIESYEKYYKNQNECNTVCDNEKEVGSDNTNKVHESNGHDLSNDESQNLSDDKKCDSSNDSDRKRIRNVEAASEAVPCKKRRKEFEPPKLREDNRDIFCWRCHKYVVEADVIPCYFCPRVFHLKCVHIQEKPSSFWLCTECDAISTAENPDKISPALSKLQKKDLAELLMFVLKRMRQHEGSSHYENPVDLESYPDYKDYIVKPMYLGLLENNVKNLKYASCESFLADTKWMVHNSYVFNTVHSELTLYAKAMMKNAKHECDEIINCPDCYLHANTLEEDKWFIEPCDKPHILVWARLKGFPYWPCKVMKANGTNVDVRFFGDHNKSLVPVECCYLYSKQMPSKQKKVDELEIAIKEASQHIKRLEERFHVFQYAPLKTMYNPKEEDEQRKLLLPYHDKPFFIKVKDREKLFDPNVINNIFDGPLYNPKGDQKEEPKANACLELPNALEIRNKKMLIKPLSEELSPYRHSSSNKIMKSPPLCNKPTIIIEDTDSDILSQNSFNHSRQPNIIGCEKLSSAYISNKAKLALNEKYVIGASAPIGINHQHDNSMLETAKDFNFMLNNNHFKNKLDVVHNLTEEKDNKNDDNEINLLRDKNAPSEKLKSDDERICFTSDQPNCLPLANPSLDKYNNNHFSDKLRINSNAKLINVITDNPSLINNYIFKPMVVIQKLKDEVFRDYSNNIGRKNEITTTDKLTKLDENYSSKNSFCDNGDKISLNFDLLNGNLTDLVSLTEIDLDRDESTNNKEAENIKCNGPGTSNGLTKKAVSCHVRPIIKSEKIDDDEMVDSDYIEKLSKSILESTLDYGDVHCHEENRIFSSDIKNATCERILLVDQENHPLINDKAIIRSNNTSIQNSPNQVIDLETIEDIEEPNSQKCNGIIKSIISNDCSVVDSNIPETDINHKAIYLSEKEDQDKDYMKENEDNCEIKKLHVDSLKQLNISGNIVKNHSTSDCGPTCNRGAINLKNILEKCADNMVSATVTVREENKMMSLEIEAILNKVEKIEAKEKLLQVLREELEKFEDHCKKKIENYKNAYIEEMDSLYTMEKQRWIQETMNVSENESRMMVDEIKKKQWCILCLNEAKFHCCWSTSYCSEKCQLADWPVHLKTCTQYSMRIGDPDLRLSPEIRKLLKNQHDALNQRFKDVIKPDKFNCNSSKTSASSPLPSSSSSEVSTKDSTNPLLTSPKSSTIYVQKNMLKQDITEGLENTGSQVMKIVSNPAVYLSNMVSSPNQTKNIIHVPKQNPAKPNIVLQDQTSAGLPVNSNKSVLFTVPLSNRNNALVSVGKTFTSNKSSGKSFNTHNNTPMLMGGQQLLLPKSFRPTKVIKKTVPLLAHKNVSCIQDKNNAAFMNAKPLYISMQNISRDNSESSDGLRDPLEITNDEKLLTEHSKLLSERNSSSSNRDPNKPAQSFLIVEKSGETAQYTYKIGFKEDIEKMSQINSMNPLGQKSTVCAVSPLSYPVVRNTPSTSTEATSTHTKN
ncbi:MYND-type zinc finger-containing chromatin reader ZMYND8 isoform X3 [Halyomorpha halys]|uniref:MYND-type zinc finger-containing chromatin reader ZMYND8 isoform X3 n=1 Tax=Halyomorpha halys TaxID=286706 RepID=UPI0034D30B0E